MILVSPDTDLADRRCSKILGRGTQEEVKDVREKGRRRMEGKKV